MRSEFYKIVSLLLVLVISLNYVFVILPAEVKHNKSAVCQCEENCKCGCKGKVEVNLINLVCFDSTSCNCKKVKNAPDFPIKEAILGFEDKSFTFKHPQFFEVNENLALPILQTEILHPPD